MSVPAAFLVVIVIWSTTPLAIQWSSQGWGFIFGLTGRMMVGAFVCVLLLALLRRKLPIDRKALKVYAAAGIGIYGAMMCVYWATQYIPTGVVAIVFGLSPVVTGLLASFVLNENSITPGKMVGAALGVAGLWVIFGANIDSHIIAWQGLIVMLFSVFFHSLSTVIVKRINTSISGFTVTTGGLLVVLPLYLLTWFLIGGSFPEDYELKPVLSLVYLGVLGSAIGFSLYFYVLKHVQANKVTLIALITPVSALLLGNWLNNETIPFSVWLGSGFILLALIAHQWGDFWLCRIWPGFVSTNKIRE